MSLQKEYKMLRNAHDRMILREVLKRRKPTSLQGIRQPQIKNKIKSFPDSNSIFGSKIIFLL